MLPTCGIPSHFSAVFIDCLAFLSASLGSSFSHSGKRPGATASTRQAMARPSFQSLLKLFVGKVRRIFTLHHARSACFGVISLILSSSSSILARLIWYLRIKVNIKPTISSRFPFIISLASKRRRTQCD